MVSVNRAIYSLYTVAAVAIFLVAAVILFYEHELSARDRIISKLERDLASQTQLVQTMKRDAKLAYQQIGRAQAEILELRLDPVRSYERIGDATQLLYSIAHK